MIWALHGMVGDPTDWDFLQPHLPLLARQLWGEVDSYRAWARGFCNDVKQRDDAPILLGYSMGARLALHALLEDPKLWRGAILVSGHTGIRDYQARRIRGLQDDEWSQKLRAVPWDVFLKIWNDQSIFHGSAPPGERLTTFRWRQSIIRSFDHWGLGRQEDLLPRLAELPMPVLWICGEMDAKYIAIARNAIGVLPCARLEILAGCGHRVPWEAPQEFLQVLKRFLAQEALM
ncbi:MAG: alpha/beta fold hydrolase [Verrucomicrobiales bacterium]